MKIIINFWGGGGHDRGPLCADMMMIELEVQ